ncbi:MAG: carbamoyltransferase C-terminal domain-containing protein, partial [Elusimicrobiota bacterium]
TFRADPALARFRSGDVAGLESLLGPKRDAAVPIVFAGTDRRHADAAASLQELTEEVLLGLAGKLRKDTGSANLALAGGVALNCQANGALARSGIFERLWVFPAAKDCGTAFGAAAMAWLKRRGAPVREEWRHAFLGAPDKAGAAELALSARGLKGEAPGPRELIEKAADLLASGKIVAWYEGAMEVGPRALGHRSLLADPRSDAMKRRLNERVKHRRPFRPYGPVLREEDADLFFEIPEAARLPCRFMLAAVRARAQAYERIPAALHADGTARPQLIAAREHPRLHALLGRFDAGGAHFRLELRGLLALVGARRASTLRPGLGLARRGQRRRRRHASPRAGPRHVQHRSVPQRDLRRRNRRRRVVLRRRPAQRHQ